MEYLLCALVGYGLGCISPSWMISKVKHTDIQKSGTGNLGTTNTFIHFGKGWGSLVLICDMAKAFLAVKLCAWLFPGFTLAGVIAGCMAVIGHIFPFYNHFRGGKGIASFAGFVLAVDIWCFLLLLVVGCILSLIFNYGCSISFSAAALFPFLYSAKIGSGLAFLFLAVCSVVIICKHIDNIRKIRAGEERKIREFLKKYIFGRSQSYGKL